MPEIEINGLTFTYENRVLPALQDVNIKVEKGEFILLAGQSGCGKSTLVKCLNGLIPHRYVGRYAGEVKISGQIVAESNLLELGLRVGTVMQEVEKQVVSPIVEDEIAFGPSNLALPRDVIEEKVLQAASTLGLEELRQRSTYALSGGQRQRVAIADIVSMEPSVVLFDEPLANLDSEGIEMMQGVFRTMSRSGKTVLVAEHRTEEVLKAGPSRVVVMAAGRIAADSRDPAVLTEFADVLKVPAEYLIHGGPRHHLPGRGRLTMAAGEPIVKCTDLAVEYPGGARALDGVSLEIRRGERIALLGNNGAGKSTLALTLTGIIKPTSGAIYVGGKDSKGLAVSDIAKTIAVVFQSPFLMLFSRTVREELLFGPKNIGTGKEEIERIVPEAARECGVDHLLDGSPFATSFGEKKRVCVASVLAMQPECVILDEPTAGQDYANCTHFMDFIDSVQSAKSFVVITHDPDLAIDYTDRTVVMHGGRVIADGPTKEVLANKSVLKEAAIRETSLISLSTKLTGGRSVMTSAELFAAQSSDASS
ncbi:MAG: ABC transporter ATP-binding protein [Nitrososphaerota archaeon]|nr:ABC transporter ATP-binding protein [Nitrososphaerota archaeon]MDG6919082.1 ABC transporter ATP-binding protein [Nitrososphaerota archaeon]